MRQTFGMPLDAARPFGPNSAAILDFLDRVRRLSAEDGQECVEAFLGTVTTNHEARLLQRRALGSVARTCRAAGLEVERRRARAAAAEALAASPASDLVPLRRIVVDLAGALVVEERLPDDQFDLLADPWESGTGERVG